jgi:hypothetical protein
MKSSDLKAQSIGLKITLWYETATDAITGKQRIQGREEIVTLQLLSKHKWERIGFMVDDPIPPPNPQTGKPDYDSMRYKAEFKAAVFKRDVMRLAYALDKGGDYEFESDDLEEQAAELQEIDAGVFNAWFTELQNATTRFEVKVSASADNFRQKPVPASEVAHHETPPEPIPSMG